MTHLTTSQILQFIDGTADYASQAQCTSHLAVCARCRSEVEFQRKLAKASRQNLHRASSRLTVRVMAKVAPPTRKKLSARVLDNLANIFAMAVVLAIMGYAISSTAGFQETQSDPRVSTAMKTVFDAYVKFKGLFQQETTQGVQKYVPRTTEQNERLMIFVIVTLLSLGVIDRFVLRRFIKLKM